MATSFASIDGLKVEALAACGLERSAMCFATGDELYPPTSRRSRIRPGAAMCFATGDELYGGVWRPVRPTKGSTAH